MRKWANNIMSNAAKKKSIQRDRFFKLFDVDIEKGTKQFTPTSKYNTRIFDLEAQLYTCSRPNIRHVQLIYEELEEDEYEAIDYHM